MAIFEKEFYVNVRAVASSGFLTNAGVLSLLEEVACKHSDEAGYGINQMNTTHLSWVVLHWKVKILKRPIYNDNLIVKTWASEANKFFTLRDFEIYDENNELVCIASSKWALINTDTGSIAKISNEVLDAYKLQYGKSVFNEDDIKRLKEPSDIVLDTLAPSYTFTVQRRDIDMNLHMHNLYYLDYAIEALPDEVYKNLNCNQFEIMYKNGAKLGTTVNCFYFNESNISNDLNINQNSIEHLIVMKHEESKQLIAIIKLY